MAILIDWDSALVEELVGRRVIPFLGAGATKSCIRQPAGDRTPSWAELLDMLLQDSTCSEQDREIVSELVSKERFLDAAEVIRENLTSRQYGHILSREFSNIEPGELHNSVLRLDQRVVMTTNYDSVYEDLCMSGLGRDGYTQLNYYDQGLANRLRSPIRLILKLHGSVKASERTVLTRSEYFKARAQNSSFFSMVQSLMATNTILFIGYSLTDPDIQLLLETSNVGESDSFGHYAVVPQGMHKAISKAVSESYAINLIEYDASSGHDVVIDSVSRLADEVEARRETS